MRFLKNPHIFTALLVSLMLVACMAQRPHQRLDPKKKIPCPQKDC